MNITGLKIAVFVGTLVLAWVLIRVDHFVFKKIRTIHEGLYLRFFERIIAAVLLIGGVLLAFSAFGGFNSIWRTVLGGTALASAVLIFAAQDSIKDILAGLMISIYKPFEIGNRVELEDGTTGIVKDITMRHVVLQLLDSQVLIIPNSKLNAMKLRNFSYHAEYRSALCRFRIAYTSDVEKAMEVIRQAIVESEYTIPGKMTDHGPDYAPIYFLAYEDSSLRLDTTIYYEPSSPSEVVISDVNLRVNHALKQNGIEIPYEYINVVHKGDAVRETGEAL
ncbi:MAG: mechanosensitive ion channel family protein [Lachnospiraceae bacterium]|nr:mechanosensitive ion channel family protein [Lachnospiraceae bacterium]